jgi:predicted nicotinamide N-methyase
MKVIFFIKIINSIRQDSTFGAMKLFQYIYYFFRSLRYRGFKHTFHLLRHEGKFEKQLGINTHSIVNLNKLTLAGEDSDQNHHYQGASYYILFSILSKLPESVKDKPFIDFGSGKGRPIFVAEQCGFTNLIGVDIAKELIEDATENKKVYIKKNNQSEIHFIFNDATKFQIPNNAAVFYFFNPFGPEVLQAVISNIKKSVEQHPREIYCIYLNPKYKAVFEENGFNVFYIEKNKRYLEGIIYRY